MIDTLIVGAGLSGLTAAYFLKKGAVDIKVLESRDRCGGRIHTIGGQGDAPVEMGATWLGLKHQSLIQLLSELGIETFPQIMGTKAIYEPISTSPPYLATLPPNPEPSLRLQGGTMRIIDALSEQIGHECIMTSHKVKSIQDNGDHVLVKTASAEINAQRVILTLPPNLLFGTVDFTPALPADITRIAEVTHTWMGESIKIAFRYAEPFWRQNDSSGTIVSNVGPIPEMYDHSNVEDNSYALMGFLNGNYHNLTKEERLALILKQLRKYYGDQVDNFLEYREEVWRNHLDTFKPYKEHVLPHQNNGHPIYQSTYYDGKLILAGSETAAAHPGYMDGAVSSGIRAAQVILNQSS